MSAMTQNRAAIFRRNMRHMLRSHFMSQREAAERFGMSYKSMRRFCHYGLQRPDKRTEDGLNRLAAYFGLALQELWNSNSYSKAKPPLADTILHNLDWYCRDRFIEIPKSHWAVLAHEAATDEARKGRVAKRLAKVIGRYPPPCPQISDDRRHNDFDLFMGSPDERADVEMDSDGLQVGSTSPWSRIGCRFLNSWFLENRISGGHRSSPSLVGAWNDPSRRTSIMRAALSLKKHLNEVTAYESAAMKIHVPANFRPTAARSICNDFGNGGTVLDFSAGYGGRFLGFLGSDCSHYVGIDPNMALKSSYEGMFNWIEQNHQHDKSWEMLWEPAEEIDYSNWHDKVDLIFTSPPYFNLESYSDEPTQSASRYQTLDEWLNGFLFETLRRAVPCLKPGGHLVLNIADNSTFDIHIVERTIKFVTHELGLRTKMIVPYLLSSRPGATVASQRVGWGRKSEPMLVFEVG